MTTKTNVKIAKSGDGAWCIVVDGVLVGSGYRTRREAVAAAARVQPAEPARIKRGYSTAFRRDDDGKRRQYVLDQIPGELWSRVSAKCKRTGVSRRAVILQLLSDWESGAVEIGDQP